MREWRDLLTELMAGPYAGSGGNAVLARDLGVHPQTLKLWRMKRVEPTYAHRQALQALWQEKCGGAS